MRYALVKDNEVLEFRNYAPNVDQDLLPLGKPRMLPVVVVADECDTVSEVLNGPTYEIEAGRVVERYISRALTTEEIDARREAKGDALEVEFARLYCLPISYSVGGQTYVWHADTEARENITGVLQMYRESELIGVTLPDPRPWTPMGSTDPVQISRAELAGLGIAIGARKDAYHAIKKAKQAILAGLETPQDLDAFDPLAGWEIN